MKLALSIAFVAGLAACAKPSVVPDVAPPTSTPEPAPDATNVKPLDDIAVTSEPDAATTSARDTAVSPEPGDAAAAPQAGVCPLALIGPERGVNRVIPKTCGVVSVPGTYALDDGSLTIEAGVTLAFKDGASLDIGLNAPAKLIIQGTAESPVTFTAMGDKVEGAWRGLHLGKQAGGSSLVYLTIEWAMGQGSAGDVAWWSEPTDVVVDHVKTRTAAGVFESTNPR